MVMWKKIGLSVIVAVGVGVGVVGSEEPSRAPSVSPVPSFFPSNNPSTVRSNVPSMFPSVEPSTSFSPSAFPTLSAAPSGRPSVSAHPSAPPSASMLPTKMPSSFPTPLPSPPPSSLPTHQPTIVAYQKYIAITIEGLQRLTRPHDLLFFQNVTSTHVQSYWKSGAPGDHAMIFVLQVSTTIYHQFIQHKLPSSPPNDNSRQHQLNTLPFNTIVYDQLITYRQTTTHSTTKTTTSDDVAAHTHHDAFHQQLATEPFLLSSTRNQFMDALINQDHPAFLNVTSISRAQLFTSADILAFSQPSSVPTMAPTLSFLPSISTMPSNYFTRNTSIQNHNNTNNNIEQGNSISGQPPQNQHANTAHPGLPSWIVVLIAILATVSLLLSAYFFYIHSKRRTRNHHFLFTDNHHDKNPINFDLHHKNHHQNDAQPSPHAHTSDTNHPDFSNQGDWGTDRAQSLFDADEENDQFDGSETTSKSNSDTPANPNAQTALGRETHMMMGGTTTLETDPSDFIHHHHHQQQQQNSSTRRINHDGPSTYQHYENTNNQHHRAPPQHMFSNHTRRHSAHHDNNTRNMPIKNTSDIIPSKTTMAIAVEPSNDAVELGPIPESYNNNVDEYRHPHMLTTNNYGTPEPINPALPPIQVSMIDDMNVDSSDYDDDDDDEI